MKTIKPILISAIILIQLSCSKAGPAHNPGLARIIRFELYTQKDLSDNNGNVTFSLFIKNRDHILFDSALTVMKIKDIPDSTQKIVFEKRVPKDNGSELAAGFRYVIEGVGYSSHIDTCKTGQLFKVIKFLFQ
jgi:hypothetical protein